MSMQVARYFKSICLLFLLLAVNAVWAQDNYSANENYITSRRVSQGIGFPFVTAYPDTSVDGINNMFPTNYLGNTGLASPNYILNYGTRKAGFTFYRIPYQNDRVDEQSVRFYRTQGPFADLEGIVAPATTLESFRMLYSQDVWRNFNLTLKFNRYSSKGFYKRQRSFVNNFYLSNNFVTRSGRFGYDFYFLNNAFEHQENGGLRDIFLNDSTVQESKDVLPVRLSAAERDNRENTFYFKPYIRLSKGDSLGSGHFMSLNTSYAAGAYRYTDQGLAANKFYQNIFLDSALTKDSSHVMQFRNELAYCVVSKGNQSSFSAGYFHELNRTWQFADSVFSNQGVRSSLRWAYRRANDSLLTKNNFITVLEAAYIFSGPNTGNYKVEGRNGFITGRNGALKAGFNFLFENRSPDYNYKQWVGNHFRYHREFPDIQQLQASLTFSFRKFFETELIYQSINNPVYFDEDALPVVFRKTVNNIAAMVRLRKVFFKHLGLSVHHTFQNTSHKNIIRLPANITTGNIFFYGILFHKALQLQTGMQVTVYEPFKPYDYMPATQAFYIQNTWNTAGYPFAELYLNARIRPVTVFLKVQNIFQDYFASEYTLTRGYYQPEVSLWYGIRWMFFD
jgi:hypothetical protein